MPTADIPLQRYSDRFRQPMPLSSDLKETGHGTPPCRYPDRRRRRLLPREPLRTLRRKKRGAVPPPAGAPFFHGPHIWVSDILIRTLDPARNDALLGLPAQTARNASHQNAPFGQFHRLFSCLPGTAAKANFSISDWRLRKSPGDPEREFPTSQ